MTTHVYIGYKINNFSYYERTINVFQDALEEAKLDDKWSCECFNSLDSNYGSYEFVLVKKENKIEIPYVHPYEDDSTPIQNLEISLPSPTEFNQVKDCIITFLSHIIYPNSDYHLDLEKEFTIDEKLRFYYDIHYI